jgi:hypothetical protein
MSFARGPSRRTPLVEENNDAFHIRTRAVRRGRFGWGADGRDAAKAHYEGSLGRRGSDRTRRGAVRFHGGVDSRGDGGDRDHAACIVGRAVTSGHAAKDAGADADIGDICPGTKAVWCTSANETHGAAGDPSNHACHHTGNDAGQYAGDESRGCRRALSGHKGGDVQGIARHAPVPRAWCERRGHDSAHADA